MESTSLVPPYKDTGTCVLGGTDDAHALLDDLLVKTQSIRASPFSQRLQDSRSMGNMLIHVAILRTNFCI